MSQKNRIGQESKMIDINIYDMPYVCRTKALGKPVQSSMAVLGDFSIGGTILKVENLASTLQVCLDSGAKKVLLPQTSAVDLGTVPAELMSSFSLVFY